MVSLNGGAPRPWIVDSGSTFTIVDSAFAQTLNANTKGRLSIEAAGPNRIGLSFIDDVTLTVAGARLDVARLAVTPLSGKPYVGILGADLFRRYVVQIDYQQQLVRLCDTRNFAYDGSGARIPFELREEIPHLTVHITPKRGPPFDAFVIVDTGAPRALILNSPFVIGHNLLLATDSSGDVHPPGLGGVTTLAPQQARAISIGSATVRDPVIMLSRDARGAGATARRDGALGNGALQHFRVILDYRRKRMILEPADTTPLVIDHVNVVDVIGGHVSADMRVVLRNRRIASVQRSGSVTARGAHVVDGRGKFLIPGMWDMHVHIDTAAHDFFPQFLRAGVTGVRDMGSSFADVESWRDLAPSTHPRVKFAGPIVTGAVPDSDARVLRVANAREATEAIDLLSAHHVDFIKVHDWLDSTSYDALATEAGHKHTYIAGHLPIAISPYHAAAMGQRSIEHMGNGWSSLLLYTARDTTLVDSVKRIARSARDPADLMRRLPQRWLHQLADIDTARAQRIARLFVKDSIWLTPTSYYNSRPSARATLLRIFRDEGVRILAGTDVNPYESLQPGRSLHEELRALVRDGLSTAEALRAATIGPAQFLGIADSLGSVTAGKVADLVLLDGDPLRDIRNVARVDAVFLSGRFVFRATRSPRGSSRSRATDRQ